MIEGERNSEEIKNQPVLKLEYGVTNLIAAPGEALQIVLEAYNY